MNRRDILKALIGGAGVLSGMIPIKAFANKFMGNMKGVDAIEEITSGEHTVSDKLELSSPDVAENGAQVQISVDATKIDGVESIYLVVDKNPKPVSMKIDFESSDVLAFASFRVKMGQTTRVTAIAKTSTGFLTTSRVVKVTKGGCA